jgi:IS5 family transposase
MKPKLKVINEISFTTPLHTLLNEKHPIYILAQKVDWGKFDTAFSKLYSKTGRPAKPIRLMVGLLILKHLRNLSDESIVEQWIENVYYQYFCGEISYVGNPPCEASELVHFRKRIGEEGIELIFQESIRINGDDSKEEHVSIDTTVQEKNITYPTDAKLYRKIIKKCQQISAEEQLPVRQSYTQVLKQLAFNQRFRNHPKNGSKARKADKKVKTIAGKLVRELERNLAPNHKHQSALNVFKQILNQTRTSTNKIYSTHEPDVCCISKGKEHKKFEFGNKVSIVYTQNTGVIVGAKSFRNEYDGHTLESALQQVSKLVGKTPKTATADRGYRGHTNIGETEIQIPKPFNNKTLSKYKQRKLKKSFKRRAAIEPIIGHLKQDHRLSRNYYAKIFGDNINVMLSAAAYNFKRMLNKWKTSFWAPLQMIILIVKNLFQALYIKFNLNYSF